MIKRMQFTISKIIQIREPAADKKNVVYYFSPSTSVRSGAAQGALHSIESTFTEH